MDIQTGSRQLRDPEVFRNGKLETVSYNSITSPNEEEIKFVCGLCFSVYTERPFMCRCSSNVFLQDVNTFIANHNPTTEKELI